MRTVASYALETSSDDPKGRFDEVLSAIKQWLTEKGWPEGSAKEFQNSQGNKTRVARVDLVPNNGNLTRFAVIERTPESIFVTEIAIANDDKQCAVFVELRLEGVGARLQPFRFDVRRPKFIGRLLHQDLTWRLGDTPLTDRPYKFSGSSGGQSVVDILWHNERSVPTVIVSLVRGEGITSNFVDKLAGDLAGLAIVASVDEEAAWAITRLRGVEWSCFNGALRLYWPFGQRESQPRLHPLWLRSTMLGGGDDASTASYRMRTQLRRMILGVSALSIREPGLIRRLASEARERRRNELQEALKSSTGSKEFQAIAESYAKENDQLREDLRVREERLATLEDQVAELQLALRYVPKDDAAIPPDAEIEPRTVGEAIQIARTKFSDYLLFSDSIDEGVSDLNTNAGPPDKVLRYLQQLADLAAARRAGPLGMGVVPWLSQKGVTCSGESETVRNAGGRRWAFGGEQVTFDLHLKPNDGVSPDRCVRIYFDLLDEGKIRIGWIGRHPEG